MFNFGAHGFNVKSVSPKIKQKIVEQKFKYPYPLDINIIQMPYPRAKAIDQIPAICPAPPPSPRRLDIDRCIIRQLC